MKNKLNFDDILNSKSKGTNFLNDQEYSNKYKELAKFWSNLPLYKNKDEIIKFINNLENNQVILIKSGTGSGKTVLIPKFVLKYLYPDNKLIAVTNPKTLTTQENAAYSAQTLDVELGDIVGYKYRGSPENVFSSKTKLLYCTDGILLAQILSGDKMLSDYDVIIIDEVHERPVPIDLLIYFIKNILNKRPEFKLILMSATVDSEQFSNYFKDYKFVEQDISGQSYYPIISHLTDNHIGERAYLVKGIETILNLIETTETGDILYFLPTTSEVLQCCKKLYDLCNYKYNNQPKIKSPCDSYYCIEVYGKMPDDTKELALSVDAYKKLSNKYKRKVLISTNVAESSITLPGIIYVIDSGYEWTVRSDTYKMAAVMYRRFISKAQIKQRMGRAGRTQPGECYHIYSKEQYAGARDYPDPVILVNDLTEHLMNFIKYQKTLLFTIELIQNLLTVPYIKQICGSLYFLHFYNIVKLVPNDRKDHLTGGSYVDTPVFNNIFNNKKSIAYKLIGGDYSSGYNEDDIATLSPNIYHNNMVNQSDSDTSIFINKKSSGYKLTGGDLYDFSDDDSYLNDDITDQNSSYVDSSDFKHSFRKRIYNSSENSKNSSPTTDEFFNDQDDSSTDSKDTSVVLSSESKDSSDVINEEENEQNDVSKRLSLEEINYLSIRSYDDIKKYNGSLTQFGYLLTRLSGYPLLITIMILYGILLDISSIVLDLACVMIIFDAKLENLFILQDKKIPAIFNEYIFEGSEHVSLYQIYADYYLAGQTDHLNIENFKKIDEIKENIMKITNKINREYLLKINEKYNLINDNVLSSDLSLIEKLQLAIIMSHKINLSYFDEEKKQFYGKIKKTIKLYKNKYPLVISTGQVSYTIPNADLKVSNNKRPLVYYSHANIMNNSYFNLITVVPENLLIFI